MKIDITHSTASIIGFFSCSADLEHRSYSEVKSWPSPLQKVLGIGNSAAADGCKSLAGCWLSIAPFHFLSKFVAVDLIHPAARCSHFGLVRCKLKTSG